MILDYGTFTLHSRVAQMVSISGWINAGCLDSSRVGWQAVWAVRNGMEKRPALTGRKLLGPKPGYPDLVLTLGSPTQKLAVQYALVTIPTRSGTLPSGSIEAPPPPSIRHSCGGRNPSLLKAHPRRARTPSPVGANPRSLSQKSPHAPLPALLRLGFVPTALVALVKNIQSGYV